MIRGTTVGRSTCLGWNVASLQGDLIRERFGMTGLPSVLSRVYLSWSLAELGAFAEATARGEEGVRIAEAADHPFSLYLGVYWDRQALPRQRGCPPEHPCARTGPCTLPGLGHSDLVSPGEAGLGHRVCPGRAGSRGAAAAGAGRLAGKKGWPCALLGASEQGLSPGRPHGGGARTCAACPQPRPGSQATWIPSVCPLPPR